jgi:molybdopterin synthase catalytic subunit
MQFCEIRITKQPLDPPVLHFSRTEGAVVDFFGVVRSIENERMIDAIEYEAFEAMAERQLALIADEAKDRYGLVSVVIHHRIGPGGRSFFVRAGDSTPPSCRFRGKQPDH